MKRVACVSTGNTSASMAAYAAAAGLEAIIFLPHGNISFGKLAQALEYGACTLEVEANFDQIVRVNTWGVIVCTQEAAKQMIAQGSGGKIINTGSIASRQGFWDFVPYCVAKFGTLAVTQATARGLVEHGITVNAFAPGVVDTPMWLGLNDDLRTIHDQPADADPMREFALQTLVGRPASPEELAPFLVYLASPESDYMTGQMYMVDGGQVLV